MSNIGCNSIKPTTTTTLSRVDRILSHIPSPSTPSSSSSSSSSSWPYKYTVPEAQQVLNREQIEFYENNGFLVIPGVVSTDDMIPWEKRLVDIASRTAKDVPPTMTVMKDVSQKGHMGYEGMKFVTKLQDFQDDPVLSSFLSHPEILRYTSAFIGPNARAMHTMLIQKPPGVGESGRHPLHQDLLYFPFRPAERIVCAWTAMEEINRENGGLIVIPGSHISPLFPHGYPDWDKVNKAYYGIKAEHLDQFKDVTPIHLEMKAGDTVFFHPLLVHGSGWNKTQRYRKAISCHYASATGCSYIDVANTIQSDIKEEVEGMALKRFKQKLEFVDIWRYKSRLVAGVEGTLV